MNIENVKDYKEWQAKGAYYFSCTMPNGDKYTESHPSEIHRDETFKKKFNSNISEYFKHRIAKVLNSEEYKLRKGL